MRITMQSIHRNILGNLNKITTDMNRINKQISSGRQISTISENPVNLVTSLGLHTNLSSIAKYRDNLSFGNTMIVAAENALTQMQDLALRAKTLAIQQANATVNTENRANAAEEARHLWEQSIFLANSQVMGKYVFAGYRTVGYTAEEPAPFIAGLAEGYRVNGAVLTPIDVGDTPPALTEGDLRINSIPVPASTDDGLSSIYPAASAAAKAAAINTMTTETGVRAAITPASIGGDGSVQSGTLASGDLVINGVEIPGVDIIDQDADNVLVDAINAKTADTGVIAARGSSGTLLLTAVDGRNIQIETTANGGAISGLNNGVDGNKVYFGTIQLISDNQFFLETTPTGGQEPGLDAIGLGGGASRTGEAGDVAGDGILQVVSIQRMDGNVRYAGDRNNDIAVKVSSYNALEITKNGQDAVMDTGIFTIFKNFENALRGEKLSSVTGVHEINSGALLQQEFEEVRDGRITITITDHSYYPPRPVSIEFGVDVAGDTPADIAARLNSIPGLNAAFDDRGRLKIETSDHDRYSFTFADTSGFLEMTGITREQMQVQAINQAIGDMDILIDKLSARISDFGARANRIMVQDQIYINIQLAISENLSEKEDTDMIQALMEMKAKDTAYQAALAAAAKTMQMSLVDFLR